MLFEMKLKIEQKKTMYTPGIMKVLDSKFFWKFSRLSKNWELFPRSNEPSSENFFWAGCGLVSVSSMGSGSGSKGFFDVITNSSSRLGIFRGNLYLSRDPDEFLSELFSFPIEFL